MAESTVMLMSALMLELDRKQRWLRNMQPGLSVSKMTSRMIKGKTIGVIGYGRIAREAIQRLQGWGVKRFMVFTRSKPRSSIDQVAFCTLDELLQESDIVSIHCPLNDQTRNLIGEKELKAMKRDSVLVNTSRGGIIDESALYAALRDGEISAAAIDTYLEEPLAANSPLRDLENIYLTQHNIGHTRELFDSLVPRAIQNITILLDGGMPEHTVNSRLFQEKHTLSERLDENVTH